jgi:large subunit ribosomal protein L35
MPKKKTKKAAAKRFRKSAGGKILFTRAGRGHLLTCKRRKRKRALRHAGRLGPADHRRMTEMLSS